LTIAPRAIPSPGMRPTWWPPDLLACP